MAKNVIHFANERVNPDDHKRLVAWMWERIGMDGMFKAEGSSVLAHLSVDDCEVQILCVLAMNNWTTNSCEGHIASDGTGRWMTRLFAHTVYQYVFEQGNCTRFNFQVSVDNTAAIAMHDKLGHKRECQMADAYGEGKDAFFYGLTRNQWKAGRFAKPCKEKK